jgi:NADH:ubiquinone oxidoreductase subunit 2 (subunit N)
MKQLRIKQREENMNRIEILITIGLSILGSISLIILKDFIGIIIGLELIGMSIIILILLEKKEKNSKTGILYIIINSISTILMLIGIIQLYKEFGTLNIYDYIILKKYIKENEQLSLGISLIIISLMIKLGSGPFQY